MLEFGLIVVELFARSFVGYSAGWLLDVCRVFCRIITVSIVRYTIVIIIVAIIIVTTRTRVMMITMMVTMMLWIVTR